MSFLIIIFAQKIIMDADLIIDDKEIRQHNAITEAKFSLTEVELNIYFMVLAQIQDDDPVGTLYNVYFQQIEEITGNKLNWSRTKKVAVNLLNKKMKFINPDTGRPVVSNLVASVELMEGGVQIELSKKLHKYLVGVKAYYTSYQLYCTLSLSSKYAKRLYMICSQWKNNEVSKIYDVDDLRDMFELEGAFERWTDFKNKVLEISRKQITEYTNLSVDYKAYKVGREYKQVQFFIKQGNPHQRIIDFNDETYQQSLKKIQKMSVLLDKFKLREDQVNTVVNRMDWGYVREKLKAIDERVKDKSKKPIDDIGAYTATVLGL